MHTANPCSHIRKFGECLASTDPALLSYLRELSIELLPILLTALVAIPIFYHQRRYDMIRQRYLDHGIDVASSYLAEALSASRNNWARQLDLLRQYQTVGTSFNLKQLDEGFISINAGDLKPLANQRIHYLINNPAVWVAYQKVMAMFKGENEFMTVLAPQAMRVNLNSATQIKQSLIQSIEQRLLDIDNKLAHASSLVSVLEGLAEEFQSQKYTFSKLKKFSRRTDVRNYISMAEEVSQCL